MDYDVIIAGGSFAGLAAAVQLRGKRVLLIEPHAIGAVQTSACGTLLGILAATGTTDSLIQVHDRIVVHVRERVYEYLLPYPFCTFDYHTFCYNLLAQADVELLHASVLGHWGHLVYTTRGTFDAEILIDATGWRAALSTNVRGKAKPHTGKSFGLETVVPVEENGLHFYYDKKKQGSYNVGWLFPIGKSSRAGFASYQGHTRLSQSLHKFMKYRFDHSSNVLHGGYFPYIRQQAVTDSVIRVGDAAGQCFPFTGEGIRPALYFGAVAGNLARSVLAGEMREPDTLRTYRGINMRQISIMHQLLLAGQKIIPGLPMGWLDGVASYFLRPKILYPVFEAYRNVINPDRLAMIWLSYSPDHAVFTPVEHSLSEKRA
jgi:flavin-dependent dehydrogenase